MSMCASMDRRTLLKHLAILPGLPRLWAGFPTQPKSARPSKRLPRVRPSDPSWPSAASWEKLKQQVGGQLMPVQFPLPICATSLDDATCQDVLKNLQNPYYIGDQPGLTQTLGWVNAWVTKPSVYAVAARNAQDIAAAVDFARDHRLRLVVKGGGHSYLGTSNAPDSLLIWTRHMNDITMHSEFIPQGCTGAHKSEPAVTLGAGAIWIQAYDAVTTKGGRYVQGGGCTTVGVAGLIQSGGFGSFSKGFGTAAGSLLEAQIVTADGVLRTVNACQDAELYWALKGGGGGSWGVITQVTLRTHDLPQLFGAAEGTVRARTDQAFRELILRMLGFYRDNLLNPHWGEQLAVGPDNTLHISMVCQGLDTSSVEETWRPLFDHFKSNPDLSITGELWAGTVPARHWWDAVWRKGRGDSMIDDP